MGSVYEDHRNIFSRASWAISQTFPTNTFT
jgi:hypothetical protein